MRLPPEQNSFPDNLAGVGMNFRNSRFALSSGSAPGRPARDRSPGRCSRSRLVVLAFSLLGILAPPLTASAQRAADAADPLAAVLEIKARVPRGARSASSLGPERQGSGTLIRDGYVLTIGYLVTEAESIEVTDSRGRTVQASVAGYDHASGLGLLKLAEAVDAKPLALGDSAALADKQQLLAASGGGREGANNIVYVVSRRPFTGAWEYMLDAAIYTYPPVDNWSGAALISPRGQLIGVGSLLVPDAAKAGEHLPGNMFVPVHLIAPIVDELIAQGRAPGAARPWLGLNTDELRGRLFISRVSPGGPAELAGLKSGDLVVALGKEEPGSLAEFYRRLWLRGAAGVDVPLTVLQGAQLREIVVRSIDRDRYFRPAR